MRLPSRLVAAAVPAAMLLACPLAAASAHSPSSAASHASAAAHGHAPAKSSTHGKSGTHGKSAGKSAKPAKPGRPDPLAGERRGAANMINAQLRNVQRLETGAGGLTGPDAAALQAVLAADDAAIQSDRDAVAAAADRAGVRAAAAAAAVSAQVARAQYRGVVAADAAVAQADTMEASVQALQQQLADQQSQGVDTTQGDADLEDAATQLTTVGSDAAEIVSTVLGMAPTASRVDQHAAQGTVDADSAAISDALDAAQADIDDVTANFAVQ